jgi:formamidopyrimidine-DNA glycosylase
MSGQFLVDPTDLRHTRASFRLRKGSKSTEIHFNDQRTFGWVSVEETIGGIPTCVQSIASDPFEESYDQSAVVENIRRRKVSIKTAILNQNIVAGIGNIYADESLWRAKIHPETQACDLSVQKIGALVDAATEVMAEALDAGGTSFDALYMNVNGESGYFKMSLAAYGQEHQPCPRCGREIRRISFTSRSSHFCPKCQVK